MKDLFEIDGAVESYFRDNETALMKFLFNRAVRSFCYTAKVQKGFRESETVHDVRQRCYYMENLREAREKAGVACFAVFNTLSLGCCSDELYQKSIEFLANQYVLACQDLAEYYDV